MKKLLLLGLLGLTWASVSGEKLEKTTMFVRTAGFVSNKTYSKQQTQLKHNFHRRRIYTEEKAKVVAAVWGAEFI